jgi:hypothetical protein
MDHDAKISEVFQLQKLKTDWLGLEHALREVLRGYRHNEFSSVNAMKYIDGYIGAYTLRGQELPE